MWEITVLSESVSVASGDLALWGLNGATDRVTHIRSEFRVGSELTAL